MKLSIIIPYRDRAEHLKVLLKNINDKVKEKFDVLIVEQFNNKPFNRGKLLNIGFDYKKNNSDYFCFHDVDMIPNEYVDYSYPDNAAIHLAAKVSQFKYELPCEEYCGGVNLFTKNDFVKINGFSNEYWGWGAEDDDLYLRIINSNLKFERRSCTFESLPHKKNINEENYKKNHNKLNSKYDYTLDGLSNLSYKLIKNEYLSDFAEKIKVDF